MALSCSCSGALVHPTSVIGLCVPLNVEGLWIHSPTVETQSFRQAEPPGLMVRQETKNPLGNMNEFLDQETIERSNGTHYWFEAGNLNDATWLEIESLCWKPSSLPALVLYIH